MTIQLYEGACEQRARHPDGYVCATYLQKVRRQQRDELSLCGNIVTSERVGYGYVPLPHWHVVTCFTCLLVLTWGPGVLGRYR